MGLHLQYITGHQSPQQDNRVLHYRVGCTQPRVARMLCPQSEKEFFGAGKNFTLEVAGYDCPGVVVFHCVSKRWQYSLLKGRRFAIGNERAGKQLRELARREFRNRTY
ncbi:hypothetical protein GCM10009631_16650 [Corynebacterium glaucum]